MKPRFLLDTHIVVRWLASPKKLSREQTRVLNDAVKNGEPVGISAMTLLEVALMPGESARMISPREVLAKIDLGPEFQILPITIEVADEVAALGPSLRDPGDRAIVATARVHRLRLLSSDQRIIDSQLVSVIA